MFQFNDPEGIIRFKELTSANTLTNCINDSDVKQSSKKWLQNLNNILHRSFKKIRITNRKMKTDDVHMLMKAKTQIKNKIDEISRQLESNPSDIKKQSQISIGWNQK